MPSPDAWLRTDSRLGRIHWQTQNIPKQRVLMFLEGEPVLKLQINFYPKSGNGGVMDGRMEYVKRTKLQISFSPTNWLKYKKERHNKVEELLSEGEKEIANLHTSVSFENTSCKKCGKSEEFYFSGTKQRWHCLFLKPAKVASRSISRLANKIR